MAEQDEGRLGGEPRGADAVTEAERYGVGRLLALSDGVFAIAMTLLILDVPVPQLTTETDGALLAALVRLLPNVTSFALSFVLVGVYWIAHRRLLTGLVRAGSRLLWLNLLMLLLVCAVPFTAAVLSRYGNLATAVILYAVNLAALGLLSAAMQAECWHAKLVDPVPPPRARLGLMSRQLLGTIVFIASIPLALYNPRWGEYSWLLLLAVVGTIRRRFQQAPTD